MVSYGRFGPELSIRKTSSEKALSFVRIPIAFLALSINYHSPWKSSRTVRNFKSRLISDADLLWLGRMVTEIPVVGPFRSTTSAANRVHRLILVGKGMPDIASKVELFPEDWSPHTMI